MSAPNSVYKKDYLWPPRKPYFPRTDLTCTITGPKIDYIEPVTPKNFCKQSEDASNAVLGPCPKTEILEFSEIDSCLKKMLDENPNLLNVMRKKPMLNAPKKFHLERLKSTYQADYDHVEDQTKTDLTGLIDKRVTFPLDESNEKEEETATIDCRLYTTGRAEAFRRKRQSRKDKCGPKTSCTLRQGMVRRRHKVNDPGQPEYKKNILPNWSSEYRDEINRTAVEITKELSMSKKKRELLRLKHLLKPRMICNYSED